jgi:hypothetical protein
MRRRAWVWNDEMAAAESRHMTQQQKWSGMYGRCPMVSSAGNRCTKPYLHRLGHTTKERTNA